MGKAKRKRNSPKKPSPIKSSLSSTAKAQSSPSVIPSISSSPLDSQPPFDTQSVLKVHKETDAAVAKLDLEPAVPVIATLVADPDAKIPSHINLASIVQPTRDEVQVISHVEADPQHSAPTAAPEIEILKPDPKQADPSSTVPAPIAISDTSTVKQAEPSTMEQAETWCSRAKGTKPLRKTGEAFTLPSGEQCIKIPNSVIEKNRKAWEPFVMEPPSQGTIHNIVNGIWSKHYCDFVVSKMEGHSFLFCIPNVATITRVIQKRLWQIEGQTMFVDKWESGITPVKPELTSAPIWLELRKVPFQFFNDDGLERIASLVGLPKNLHPMTANKKNLEVAKVFTIIDPRKPLPEAVNVQFELGVISRVMVSSPWMPPVRSHCKEIGHSIKRCPITRKAPTSANGPDSYHPANPLKGKRRKTRRSKSKKNEWVRVSNPPPPNIAPEVPTTSLVVVSTSKLGTKSDFERGGSSTKETTIKQLSNGYRARLFRYLFSESEEEKGEILEHENDFQLVKRKHFSGIKGSRGRIPKLH
ncbi:hypothetical protein N665_0234s0002 [Sinapis alba]|nr:hypothetical protein N665_0234s0002 [Sinapis alba]